MPRTRTVFKAPKQKPIEIPAGSVAYIRSPVSKGKTPEKVVTILITERSYHVRELHCSTKLKEVKTEPNGSRSGKIDLVSPLKFNPDGSTQPFELKLPDELQEQINSGEAEVHIILDTRIPIGLGSDVHEKIRKMNKTERCKLSATSKVWRKGVK